MYTKDLPIYVLNYAIPSKEAIVDYSSGLRPYREGGIRMELQVV